MRIKSTENDPEGPCGLHLWQIRAVRDLLWLLGALALVWLLVKLKAIFLPMFAGFLLAYLVHPLLKFGQLRAHIPRPVSILLIFLLVLLVFGGAGLWLGPLVKDQSLLLVERVPDYLERIGDRYGIEVEDLAGQFKSEKEDSDLAPVVVMARKVLGTTTDILLWIILLPLYFAFFAWHFQAFLQQGRRYLLLDRHPQLKETLRRMDAAVGTFLRARVLISLLVGVVFCVGWWLASVPFWFLLGAITGLFSIVPYLSVFGWLLALVIKYLEATGAGAGFDFMAVLFWPSLVFGIGNFMEMWVFTPLIHGRTTQLSPVMILTVVLSGGILAGFWGLLLAIPVALCMNILLLEFGPTNVDDIS